MMPECKSEADRRGLCTSCYQAAGRRVRLGEITWEALVDAGLALEAQIGRPGNAASRAIQELNQP